MKNQKYYHHFHIPVMGTGFTADTPVRVAHFGINSVVSLVDDLLLEKLRQHYTGLFGIPYERIARSEPDSRARHITAYLDAVNEIVRQKFEAVKSLPFFADNDKKKYFELLPNDSPLRIGYEKLLRMVAGPERDALAEDLTGKMVRGSIDVNIMVKLDRMTYDRHGQLNPDTDSDAKSALRGYGNSVLDSSIVFSAGINQSLFSYMTRFNDFYRDAFGVIKKRIILKVSDFRSALIQGKFLAKKGLEVAEFRIESGLNCGGHAFASNGVLLPSLLEEFRVKRDELMKELQPMITSYYESIGRVFNTDWFEPPLVTVQGGIGTAGEVARLREHYGIDRTGWASPFLLVPEATAVDTSTRELLKNAGEKDLYLSMVSPLGVPFNNIRGSGSEVWTTKKIESGKPGSPCPKGFLQSNTEFTATPICTASSEYQTQKLAEIAASDLCEETKKQRTNEVLLKTCICDHLGNAALIVNGIIAERFAPQSICPGPNIAWFTRLYSLREMVDHIYGRGESLVPAERPHMFAKEIVMYVDYFEHRINTTGSSPKERKSIDEFYDNMVESINYCISIASGDAYPGENLASLPPVISEQRARLDPLYELYTKRSEELVPA